MVLIIINQSFFLKNTKSQTVAPTFLLSQSCLKFLFADATALARDFVGDRQFNLGSPRMILTNVSWTSKGIEKLLSNENISLEQS